MIPLPPDQPIDLKQRFVRFFFVGGGAAMASAVVWSAMELMRRNPELAFQTLQQWGPWFVLAIVAMYLIWDTTKRLILYVGKLAEGMQSLSSAVTRIAEKDDRQYEEMRMMVQYAARTSDRTMELLHSTRQEQATAFKQLSQGQDDMRQMLGASMLRRRGTDDKSDG